MKSRMPKMSAEFKKWMKEYLYLFEEAQNIQHLPYSEQFKLLRNQHPFILDDLTKKGMPPDIRELLDNYLQILMNQCKY